MRIKEYGVFADMIAYNYKLFSNYTQLRIDLVFR